MTDMYGIYIHVTYESRGDFKSMKEGATVIVW